MSDFIGDWNALLVLLLAGFLPNEVWRMLGLWFGGGAGYSFSSATLEKNDIKIQHNGDVGWNGSAALRLRRCHHRRRIHLHHHPGGYQRC